MAGYLLENTSVTPTFLACLYTAAVLGIILNSIEMHLLRKCWRRITHFEIILLYLAGCDLFSAIGSLIMACFATAYYVTGSYTTYVFAALYFILIIGIASSMLFVIIIGIERLTAIRMPLKHRIWHTTKRKLWLRISIALLADLVILSMAVILDRFLNKDTEVASAKLVIALAAMCLTGVFLILVLYGLIAFYILKRNSIFIAYDQNSRDKKMMHELVRKEKATIIACLLVVVSFFVCNIPFVSAVFNGRSGHAEDVLITVNAVLNPVIYFFKNYLEDYFKKRRGDASLSNSLQSTPLPLGRRLVASTRCDIAVISTNNGSIKTPPASKHKTEAEAREQWWSIQNIFTGKRENALMNNEYYFDEYYLSSSLVQTSRNCLPLSPDRLKITFLCPILVGSFLWAQGTFVKHGQEIR